jgi:cytochrome c-type biogenesis protein CcmF
VIGIAGAAFNQDKESEKGMSYGDKMEIGSYTLVCRSYTEEDKPNYGSEWAIIDVYQKGRQIDTLYPERRFYKASQQAQTLPTIRSTMQEDLYLVYEGQNEKNEPIIKAHLNPLVMWIWLGVWIILGGTVLALVPNASAPVRVTVPRLVEHAIPAVTGD